MSYNMAVFIISFNTAMVILSCFWMLVLKIQKKKNLAKIAALRTTVDAYEHHIREYGVCPLHMPSVLLILPVYPRRRPPRYSHMCRRCYVELATKITTDGDGGVVHRFPVQLN